MAKSIRPDFDSGHERWNLLTFDHVLKILKKKLKPSLPIRVVFSDTMPDYGSCTIDDSGRNPKFVITIASWQCEDSAIGTLIHEWAHAISWTFGQPYISDHGPEWGVAYARVYSTVIGE